MRKITEKSYTPRYTVQPESMIAFVRIHDHQPEVASMVTSGFIHVLYNGSLRGTVPASHDAGLILSEEKWQAFHSKRTDGQSLWEDCHTNRFPPAFSLLGDRMYRPALWDGSVFPSPLTVPHIETHRKNAGT